MKINIGTQNKVKVEALTELLPDYSIFKNAEILPLNVSTDVDEQPKSLEETIRGAKNRAKNAFINCDYSFGIESGMIQVPYTKTGHMDITICVIFDGKNYHIGKSAGFECPSKITKMMFEEGITLAEACYKLGMTDKKDLGAHEGIIGILTKGRMVRKAYTKQAIITAMIHLEFPELF